MLNKKYKYLWILKKKEKKKEKEKEKEKAITISWMKLVLVDVICNDAHFSFITKLGI